MILVPVRGEKHFKPHPQNRILVPLWGEKHVKPHPQNRILIPLRGKKHFKPHPQNRILVKLNGGFTIEKPNILRPSLKIKMTILQPLLTTSRPLDTTSSGIIFIF